MKGENVPVDNSEKIKYTFKCIFRIHSQHITLWLHAGRAPARPCRLRDRRQERGVVSPSLCCRMRQSCPSPGCAGLCHGCLRAAEQGVYRSQPLGVANGNILVLSIVASCVSSVVSHRFPSYFFNVVLLLHFPSRFPSRHSQKTLFTGIS